MSTVFCNPIEAGVPPTSHRANSAKAGFTSDKHLNSHLLSLSRIHHSSLALVPSEVSESDLISAAQMGDHRAFMELCRRHSGVTRQKIFKIVRNQEDAEDALQDTLLQAYTHLTSFRRSCKFATWLTAIGVNTALMMLRKRKVRKEIIASPYTPDGEKPVIVEPVDRSLGPEGIVLKQQSILIVRRELKKLKPGLRSIVDHYYGMGCSLDDVAKKHGISLSAAKSRLSRGRNRLRSSLARHGLSKLDD